jgi:hypothetical protein
VDASLVTLLTGIAGAAIGFALTRVNDWIVERRELRRAQKHLKTEASNVVRHYSVTLEKLGSHQTDPKWLNAINIETCRFYGDWLGTFDMSALRLFDEKLADEAMLLMMTVRNNNLYVEQAKHHLATDDAEEFYDICGQLVERCRLTIDRANQLRELI